MRLFGYEITIKSLPKVTAESVFMDIRADLRDNYDDDYWEYYEVSKSVYKKIKGLAKQEYDNDNRTKAIRAVFPRGEDISYYKFEVVETKLFNRVVFRVTNV